MFKQSYGKDLEKHQMITAANLIERSIMQKEMTTPETPCPISQRLISAGMKTVEEKAYRDFVNRNYLQHCTPVSIGATTVLIDERNDPVAAIQRPSMSRVAKSPHHTKSQLTSCSQQQTSKSISNPQYLIGQISLAESDRPLRLTLRGLHTLHHLQTLLQQCTAKGLSTLAMRTFETLRQLISNRQHGASANTGANAANNDMACEFKTVRWYSLRLTG